MVKLPKYCWILLKYCKKIDLQPNIRLLHHEPPPSLIASGELEVHEPNLSSPLVITSSRLHEMNGTLFHRSWTRDHEITTSMERSISAVCIVLVLLRDVSDRNAVSVERRDSPCYCYWSIACLTAVADRSMQLNEGLFMMNNRCGYVLQPECMRHPAYDPYDKDSLSRLSPPIEPVHISLVVSWRSLWVICVGPAAGTASALYTCYDSPKG